MLLSTLAMSGSAQAAADCALGQRYLTLAHDRINAYQNDEALGFLKQAIDACPSYDAYEQLGELAAQSTQQEDQQKAVSAFVSAHALAPNPQARANTLYHYASLLNQTDDPQNAYPLIEQARGLDPENAQVAELAKSIEGKVRHPSEQHIVRALHYSLYQPLTDRGPAKGSAAQVAKYQTPAGGGGPSVNIPINFETGSTVIDPETKPNLETLAHALVDKSLAGRDFLFVGHSDARGAGAMNVNLSLQRAQAMSQRVIEIEPSLKGHIKVEGHGAREPLNPGKDEAALRANRRLQVLIR
jgi:outer membrane protein OmpA-like peptidoglycan-associated protein